MRTEGRKEGRKRRGRKKFFLLLEGRDGISTKNNNRRRRKKGDEAGNIRPKLNAQSELSCFHHDEKERKKVVNLFPSFFVLCVWYLSVLPREIVVRFFGTVA